MSLKGTDVSNSDTSQLFRIIFNIRMACLIAVQLCVVPIISEHTQSSAWSEKAAELTVNSH